MTISCLDVGPSSESLNQAQILGLKLVTWLSPGRDVVLAIDLTESVGLNSEGQRRLRQIIEESLESGNTVYVVPFSTSINPHNIGSNPLTPAEAFEFNRTEESINQLLQAVPETDYDQRNTDIQFAELSVYKGLAALNQCRLSDNRPIKPQSVVWITDAPLYTESGEDWTETPANSPFRDKLSIESKTRQDWIETLPTHVRQLPIQTGQSQTYNLTVVDIEPTVQELCTPAPGGNETCSVTPYLVKQLWLPTLVLGFVIASALLAVRYRIRLRKKWRLKVEFDSNNYERKTIYLAHKERIPIGDDDMNAIDCPGDDVRAYLERTGSRLYLIPAEVETHQAVLYRNRDIRERTLIKDAYMRINCPNRGKDFEVVIRVDKS